MALGGDRHTLLCKNQGQIDQQSVWLVQELSYSLSIHLCLLQDVSDRDITKERTLPSSGHKKRRNEKV
jgi:hypothetical protein